MEAPWATRKKRGGLAGHGRETYPRESLPHIFLSEFIYTGFGEYENAIQEAEARHIEPIPEPA